MLNLYQTPLFYLFDLKGLKRIPLKDVDDKWQITATFTVTASGSFLTIQLIFSGKTNPSIPNYDFLSFFNVTFTPNHWSRYENSVRLFKKIIFPYLKAKKEELGYPKEKYSLIVMDIFKGQDNAKIKIIALSLKNDYELVIVPHSLTNKFQPLHISINQKAKKFISHKFNTWYVDPVSEQLKEGVAPGDVKESMKISDFKILHARWIFDMYVCT